MSQRICEPAGDAEMSGRRMPSTARRARATLLTEKAAKGVNHRFEERRSPRPKPCKWHVGRAKEWSKHPTHLHPHQAEDQCPTRKDRLNSRFHMTNRQNGRSDLLVARRSRFPRELNCVNQSRQRSEQKVNPQQPRDREHCHV